MNDDFFNTYHQNENKDEIIANATETIKDTTTPEPILSEPYRYRYENGEKREDPNKTESFYSQTGYSSYDYNSSAYRYNNTASHTTAEAPVKKKKHPFLKAVKWVAGAACFGIIAGAAFIGTSYVATEVFGIELSSMQSFGSEKGTGNTAIGTGTPVNITIGSTSTIEL